MKKERRKEGRGGGRKEGKCEERGRGSQFD